MSFDQLVTRGDAAVLIPEQTAAEIINTVQNVSVAMTLMRRIPLSSAVMRMPVIDGLPQVYWVNGDTGLKETTKISWAEKELIVEELATIVPIPENVLADAEYDLWAQIRPLIVEAIARKLDAALLFGINKPTSWPDSIVQAAEAAGQVATGAVPQNVSEAMAILEGNDVPISGVAARGSVRGALRVALTALGGATSFAGAPADLWGYPVQYPTPTSQWPTGVDAIVGDFNAAILGVRQDITYKMLDQGVITDEDGKVVLNLPQQDTLALRVVARYGYAVADILVGDGTDVQSLTPFAVAKSA